jgi:hypothetical protein
MRNPSCMRQIDGSEDIALNGLTGPVCPERGR